MAEQSTGRKVGYWITTGIVAFIMGASGLADLIAFPEAVQFFLDLGYPEYIVRFIGLAKFLGAVAIVAPKFPRLKEWAYAGIVIDLTGAAYSHIANGDGPDKYIGPIVFTILAFASWYLRADDRKLPDADNS